MATQIDQASDQQDALMVTVRETSTLTVVELVGELDLATAGNLRERLVLLDLDEGINLVIDVRGLDFLGSTGIGVMVAACKRVRASGGRFAVSCDNGIARRTLEFAGLVDFLELNNGETPHPNQRATSYDDN